MTLTELRCPRCDAPIVATQSGLATCGHCGASLQDTASTGVSTLHLDDVGPDKVAVIQVVFHHLRASGRQVGLKDSKDLVETAPCVLAEELESGNARSFVKALVKAGAKVRTT